MNHFPAQYSTLSSNALAAYLSIQYSFKATCKLLIRNVSDTYVVETEHARYIFKVYRDSHRSADEISGEVQLLNMLKQQHVPVSYPVADKGGSYLQTFNAIEGTRHGVLFTWAKGEPVYSLQPEHLNTLGRAMGKFHKAAAIIELDYTRPVFNIETTIKQPMKTLNQAFKGLESEYDTLGTMANQVAAYLENLDTSSFNYGYCHYDFLPKNFHFNNPLEITFFDFDFAGKGLQANDITSFYIHYFFELMHGKISREQADAHFALFVEAYRKENHLSQAELDALPYLGFGFWIFYLGFQADNFDDWSNTFFTQNYLKQRVAIILKWMEHFGITI